MLRKMSYDEAKGKGRPQEEVSLGDLFGLHAPSLYRYALMILADHSAAEDVVQQAFMKLAASGRALSSISAYGAYLRTAVRHEAYSAIHKRRRSATSLDADSISLLESATHEIADVDDMQKIGAALLSLPPEQREVVHMRIFEQKKLRAIARELHVSINTVSSRYRYAIDKLRDLLQGLGPERD